jgi:hypothetical protein
MIYTILEYAEKFRFKGKKVSAMTLKRRCENGQLPSGHHAKKLPGKTGDWIIEVPDKIIESVKELVKAVPRTLSREHFHFK